MRPVLSCQQIRQFDQYWIQRGVPGIVLMENAGRGAAHLIGLKARPRSMESPPRQGSNVVGSCIRCADERALNGVRIVLLCGRGNNGGDGFVVARHLQHRGAFVEVYSLYREEEIGGDAQLALNAMKAVGLCLLPLPCQAKWSALFEDAAIIVDALLGTGADRILEGELAELILQLNRSTTRVISLDLPSGLDTDTGVVLGRAVEAFHTVTFAHLKRGLLTPSGQKHAGSITTSNIGVPAQLPSTVGEAAAWLLEESDVREQIKERPPYAHKGSAGRVLAIAGSAGMTGAARLVAHASMRSGAGLVTICTDSVSAKRLDSELIEVMSRSLIECDDNFLAQADALVVGPGLGRGDFANTAISRAISTERPTVLDADGLRWLACQDAKEFRKNVDVSRLVLTPHPGEAAALLDDDVKGVESDRFSAAHKIVEKFGATVILKGSRTIIASPQSTPRVSAFGSAALATAGSGDVLSGILGALLVEAKTQEDVFVSSYTAVVVHGVCAERWAKRQGDRGLLASEIADEVPRLLQAWSEVS